MRGRLEAPDRGDAPARRTLPSHSASGRDPDLVAVGIDEAEVGPSPGPCGQGLDLPAVSHGGLPRRGEGRVDVVHLDHDLHPHAAGADEVGGTEMVPRGQRAAALESDAQPPRAHRHVPLGS